jgi:hypothetical protein
VIPALLAGLSGVSPWPNVNGSLWNRTQQYATNELNVQLQYASYFITVLASAQSSPAQVNFTLHARLGQGSYPVLSDTTTSVAIITTTNLLVAGDTMGMSVSFNTSAVASYMYRVFVARSDVTARFSASLAASIPCATSSASVSSADGSLLPGVAPIYANPDRCVLTSVCGVLASAVPAGSWVAPASAGAPLTLTVAGLVQQAAYSFVVLAMDPASGAMSPFALNRGTPVYTKTNAAVTNSTMGAVVGGALGAFALAVAAAIFVKLRIDKLVHARAMAKYHAVNTGQDEGGAQAAGHAGDEDQTHVVAITNNA